MTRERWEQILFAHVSDEVVQDMLNAYVLELETENAKLRKELEESPKCETCEAMLDCDECLRADKPRKDRKRLASENAKLRELCRMFAEYVSQDRCEGCVVKRRCNEGEIEECWQRTEIREIAHELKIEVDA